MKRSCRNIVMTGTVIIWIIKFIIRPNVHLHEPLRFFLGIAPNFVGSFLIPFGAVLFFEGKKNIAAKFFSVRSAKELKRVCFTGFVLLIINEYLQKIPLFGRTFDGYDILFSAAGLILSYFIFQNSYSFSAQLRHKSTMLTARNI